MATKQQQSLDREARLADAVMWSRQEMRPYRAHRLVGVQQYTGANWSDNSAVESVPINMIEMAVNIWVRSTAARQPKALVTTHRSELRAQASDIELSVNDIGAKIELGHTINRSVFDGMFSMGAVRIGLGPDGTFQDTDGREYLLGKPFVENIQFDDLVVDMSAQDLRDVQFAGHRYTISREAFEDFDIPKRKKAMVGESEDRLYNETGDPTAQSLGINSDVNDNKYKPTVTLMDLWLPQENRISTVTEIDFVEIHSIDWTGPEAGPYEFLGFSWVPGNILPLPPVASLMDMHLLLNNLYRKIGSQANRAKTILAVADSGSDDARRIQSSVDGDIVTVQRPEATKEMNFNGVDPNTAAFALQLREMISYLGGNLDLQGGLGPQSATVGQDKLLASASSKRMSDMQDRVVDFAKRIYKQMLWYLWDDPLYTPDGIVKTLPGSDISVPGGFTPETRQGNFLDHEIKVDPYSMQDLPPSERLAGVISLTQGIIIPMMPIIQQQGGTFDMQAFLKIISKYSDFAEVEELVKFAAPEDQQGQGGGGGQERPRQSPVTTRENVRINRSGATRSGNEQAIAEQLLNSGRQANQSNQVAQGVG